MFQLLVAGFQCCQDELQTRHFHDATACLAVDGSVCMADGGSASGGDDSSFYTFLITK